MRRVGWLFLGLVVLGLLLGLLLTGAAAGPGTEATSTPLVPPGTAVGHRDFAPVVFGQNITPTATVTACACTPTRTPTRGPTRTPVPPPSP